MPLIKKVSEEQMIELQTIKKALIKISALEYDEYVCTDLNKVK